MHPNASVQVCAETEGRTRLEWITDVLPDEIAVPIGDTVEQWATAIKKALEKATS